MSKKDLPIIADQSSAPQPDPYGLERSEPLPRGVTNPEIIDLISPDDRTGEVVLTILEKRPWGSDADQLRQFDEKLNRYMSYVLDGFLSGHFPQYKGRPVRVQIDCVDEPSHERDIRFLEGVGMVCEQNDINFAVRVVTDMEPLHNTSSE